MFHTFTYRPSFFGGKRVKVATIISLLRRVSKDSIGYKSVLQYSMERFSLWETCRNIFNSVLLTPCRPLCMECNLESICKSRDCQANNAFYIVSPNVAAFLAIATDLEALVSAFKKYIVQILSGNMTINTGVVVWESA